MMVNPNQDDIATIKQRLAEKALSSYCSEEQDDVPSFVMASKDMFLIWNGKPLSDECVLADYNISKSNKNVTIFCQQRNRGGCFALSFSVLMVIIASILGSTVTCGASLILVPLLLPLLFILPFCCL
jgi:hypothetical protein